MLSLVGFHTGAMLGARNQVWDSARDPIFLFCPSNLIHTGNAKIDILNSTSYNHYRNFPPSIPYTNYFSYIWRRGTKA